MKHFDLIIIGGGASASASAIRANALGKTVCLFNKGLPLGGTCVNVGCVPSKVVIHAAEVLHQARKPGVAGIKSEVTDFDFATIIEHELKLVEMMRNKKYKAVLASLQRVTVVEEEATFVDAHTVEAGGERYAATHFHLATGSKARVLPIPGLEHVVNLTHIEALKLKRQPKSLVVIGAGPVGLELGQAYSRFGTKVTIVQRSGSIFSNTEPEVAESLREILQEDGLTILTNAATKGITKNGEGATVVVMQGDKELRIDADAILFAVGKIPNTDALNLGKAGVKVDGRKSIVVDQTYRTSAPHIFASGDVAALPMRIETTAGKEGTYVAENALNEGAKSVDYGSVMYTLFTGSQVAGVGLTEAMATKKGIACVSRSVPMAEIPKAMIIGDTRGLIKMTIEEESRRILGVHMIGPMAGDIMPYAMMAIRNQNTVDDLVESIPMFPTMAEAIKIVAISFDSDLDQMSCCT